ncbi:hypothetical protein B0G73_1368 [Paraburkholderia sp. BL25I1N1]|nr:hypothetical protein B0G73_1368 [Paraburkholderia sp. BL25I1N1]
MAQQVGSFELRVQTGPAKGAPNNTANCDRAGKFFARSLHSDEHATRRARWTNVAKTASQCRASLSEQWQASQTLTLASDNHLASLQVEIV